jgi:hypothetical protein
MLHMIAAGAVLERWPRLLSARLFAGVLTYFYVVYVVYAYILRIFPDWIDPRI